jgi:hypothetical protein
LILCQGLIFGARPHAFFAALRSLIRHTSQN